MKKPFKEGDRVSVVGHVRQNTAEGQICEIVYVQDARGTVIFTSVDDHTRGILVRFDEPPFGRWNIGRLHPRQCVRLVKKKRRGVWVAIDHFDKNGGHDMDKPLYAYFEKPPTANDWREFVEVRPKK